MKKLFSHHVEFSYELLSFLPYAYYLHLLGQLNETESSYDTSCFYFFSKKHTESNGKRRWDNIKYLAKEGVPNTDIHTPRLSFDKFIPPPLYESVKKEKIIFDKPSIIITNRYNYEWEKDPINYINIETLDIIINNLKKNYDIVYINIYGEKKYDDDAEALELKDFDFIRKYHPEVHIIHDLRKKYPQYSYNELQLRLFAGSLKFITSNGGLGVLASYFPGDNIIFSKVSRENDSAFYAFDQIYPQLSNYKCKINTARNECDLINLINEKWIEKTPHFNILIRTSKRPFYFQNCMNSIYNQNYKNWSIIVSTDDENSYEKYIRGHKCLVVLQKKFPDVNNQSDILNDSEKKSGDYGVYFGPNLYFNAMHKLCAGDYIIYLDDDDNFYDSLSLEKLAKCIRDKKDLFVIWRVSFPGRLIPSDKSWGIRPIVKDISGIGYAIPRDFLTDWRPWKRADYRIAKRLFEEEKLNTIWFNEVITQVRGGFSEDGFGKQDDLVVQDCNSPQKIIIALHLKFINQFLFEALALIANYIEKIAKIEFIIVADAICVSDLKKISYLSHFRNTKVFYFSKVRSYHGFALFLNSLMHKINSKDTAILCFDSFSLKILEIACLFKNEKNINMILDGEKINSNSLKDLDFILKNLLKIENLFNNKDYYLWFLDNIAVHNLMVFNRSSFSKTHRSNYIKSSLSFMKSGKRNCNSIALSKDGQFFYMDYSFRVDNYPIVYNKDRQDTVFVRGSNVKVFNFENSIVFGGKFFDLQENKEEENHKKPILFLKQLL